jgi:hypothetical protein
MSVKTLIDITERPILVLSSLFSHFHVVGTAPSMEVIPKTCMKWTR